MHLQAVAKKGLGSESKISIEVAQVTFIKFRNALVKCETRLSVVAESQALVQSRRNVVEFVVQQQGPRRLH